MKRYAAAILLCTVASSFGQELDIPVTYTTKAVPLHKILNDLSKTSGVKLTAAADLEDEPLILRIDKVPLQQAMDKMADVFAADWVNHQTYWRLERSDEKIAAVRKTINEKRLAAITKSIQNIVNEQDKIPLLNQQSAEALVQNLYTSAKKRAAGDPVDDNAINEFYRMLPEVRLAVSILVNMDPQDLAALPLNRKTVFSSSPNTLQRPFPAISSDLFKQYDAQKSLIYAANEKIVPQDERGLETWTWGPGRNKLGRIVAKTVPDIRQQSLYLEFTFFDVDGQMISQDQENLADVDWEADQKHYVDARQQAQKTGFALGPIAQDIAPRTIDRKSAELRPLSSPATDALLHPTTTDPLSMATSDTILGAAERDGVNAICLAPDNAEYWALNAGRLGKTSLETFQSVGTRECNLTFSEDNGWLVVKPIDPLTVAKVRMPRPALEKFIQDSSAQGFVSIDTAADLLGSVSIDADDTIAYNYVTYLLPNGQLFAMGAVPDLLRFYGSLADSTKDAAAKGTLQLHVREFDDDQKELLRRFLFEGINNPEESDTAATISNIHLLDPTDFIPTGVSDDAIVTLTDKRGAAYFAREEQFSGGAFELAIPNDALAYEIAQSQAPQYFPVLNPPKLRALTTGTHRVLTLKLMSGTKTMQDSAGEDHYASDKMMPVDQFIASLPSADREKLEAEIAQLIERAKKQMGNRPSLSPAPTSDGGGKPPLARLR